MKTRLIRIALSLLTTVLPVAGAAAASPFVWGICGHPGPSQGLWSDYATQFSTLQRQGLKSYRFDVSLTGDGTAATQLLQPLAVLSHAHHITLHPILYVPFTWNDATDHGRYPDTEAGLEAQGYDRTYPVVLQFANDIRDWELENELSLRQGFKSGTGASASDYATDQAHRWAAVLRGMSRAVHAVSARTGKPLRVVVDTVYADFGLIPFLESQGVQVDKLAYHYYYGADTSPYRITAPGGVFDVFAEMKKIGKPVIVNELNAAEIYAPLKGRPYDDAKALVSLKTHIEYLLHQHEANIEGAEFYELYDEPGKNAAESNFGLLHDPAHPKTQWLLAAAYTCGPLTPDERTSLVAHGLFTQASLAERLAACPAQ
ncbi:hypothetical protein [Dyella choica]|uniref:Arabinogalactan endo-beta-1,4-galactanase n=1 Tax=Dyella choica TaxID=1927959 RepID=A0A432M5S1_9GAMM|nr:hypothetical protein [Dyella choica]RUL75427.1 hypothetical protein EKH80_11965 [Dyella choica]